MATTHSRALEKLQKGEVIPWLVIFFLKTANKSEFDSVKFKFEVLHCHGINLYSVTLLRDGHD